MHSDADDLPDEREELPEEPDEDELEEPELGDEEFDEEAFETELDVSPLQIPGAVAPDPVPQDQVLGAGRRPDRVRLDKSHPVESPRQRGRRKETPGNGKAPKIFEGRSHGDRGL